MAHPSRDQPGKTGKTPIVIVSVAHLDDEERALVLDVLLEEVLSWVRTLPGSQRLRALLVFDEVYGFLPPHPANPPTKRPLVALMKQARAFGVGVVVATQNPMDLDYRALSNAGLWFIGRLQTDADRARVIDGLEGALGAADEDLGTTLTRLAPRWFVVRNAHAKSPPILVQPRCAMSLMRGPMTRLEIRAARGVKDVVTAPVTAAVDQAKPSQPWAGRCLRLPRCRRRDQVAFMTLREILEAIRTLPRPDRLRLADQLNRDLASVVTDEPAQGARLARFRVWLP
ncbi:MAG: hypothetical protein WDO69_08820 [Pseudomonadota bacterium]